MLIRKSIGVLAFSALLLVTSNAYSQNIFRNACGSIQNSISNFKAGMRKSKENFHRDMQRNNAFPSPFIVEDQMMIQNTFAPMYALGASQNRILDSVHFDPKTNKLNSSGYNRLRQILAQQKKLDVFVANSMNPEIDEARQTELRNVLAKYTFPGHKPNVAGAFFLPHHAVGSEQTLLRETYLSSQRAPTIESVAGNISGSAQ